MPKIKVKENNPVFLAPLMPVILNDKELSCFDRFLLALMIQLSQKKGYCFARNQHLAYVLNRSVGAVSKSINKMHKLGYIIYNEPDPDHGGRVYYRTMRKDLFYKKKEMDPTDPRYKIWYNDDFTDTDIECG